jgi:hypothetical protein
VVELWVTKDSKTVGKCDHFAVLLPNGDDSFKKGEGAFIELLKGINEIDDIPIVGLSLKVLRRDVM